MKVLALLHRWTGGLIGLLLAVIGLSGTVLLWEDSWILLDGAGDGPVTDAITLGRVVERALEVDPALSRITFAGDEIGLNQAMYADGSGAYITQGGSIVERWAGMWERPELWLFDLHHYLLMGETGKTLTGVLGLVLLAFTVSGLILWWRVRRTFRFRIWPARYTRSAIVRQHRDLGAVASPLLLLVAVTGTLMVFPALSTLLLSPLAEASPEDSQPRASGSVDDGTDWLKVMVSAGQVFPGAEPRRLMMPTAPGEPIAIRYRQEFEWTPNGRSYVFVDPADAVVVASTDPAEGDLASSIAEKYYPVHAAKVGGLVWRIVLTFAGLSLTILGLLASISFWTDLVGGRTASVCGSRVDGALIS
ncbi:PepSY-associated TM helix domain-containing protein [Aurantiacibacter spongiae]|uniref:PepSY domain-containing protein n=1 Tax=Aurantiacibacter spongiae TaxID=2488860 RepID=A0A3N5CQ24_9SPHN|nr:PepSY-associated TM helix domain-containing protein [Aurantiacibacter spongiae]RPF71114.1 PepSY domain-containing protein [Aurantiacibacter spongiae]